MEICCICLDEIKSDQLIKTLGCNHSIHYKCYMKLSINNSSFFVKCPICRVQNFNTGKPYTNDKQNLYSLCAHGVGIHTCIGKNKKGEPCKNKSVLFNYGYCHIHNKNIITKKYYKIFLTYIYHLFCSNKRGWKTKLYMIDMAKKLIIKNDLKNLEDIIIIFSKYFEKYNYSKEDTPQKFYNEHDIELPDCNWINYCYDMKILF